MNNLKQIFSAKFSKYTYLCFVNAVVNILQSPTLVGAEKVEHGMADKRGFAVNRLAAFHSDHLLLEDACKLMEMAQNFCLVIPKHKKKTDQRSEDVVLSRGF